MAGCEWVAEGAAKGVERERSERKGCRHVLVCCNAV